MQNLKKARFKLSITFGLITSITTEQPYNITILKKLA